MKKKFNRILSAALVVVLTVSLIFSGAAGPNARAATAISGQCGPNLLWRFDPVTGIITIEGTGEMDDYEHPENAPWAAFSGSIRKIVFQSGVTVIGKNAFAGSAVEEIELPDTLTAIRESAFQDCEQLTKVDASQTQLSSVEAKAFSGCGALRRDAVSMPAVTVVDETAFGEGVKEPSTPVETAPTVPSEPTPPSTTPTEPVETAPTVPSEPTPPSTTPTEPVETAPTEPEEPGRRTESFYSEKDYAQVTLTWENDVLVEKVMEYPYLNRVVTYTDFASEACPQTIVTTTNGKADTTVKREYDELGRLVTEETRDTRTGTFVESFAVTYTSEKEGVCTLRDTLGEGDSTLSGDVTLYDNGAIKTVDFGCRYGLEFGRMQHSIVEYDEDGFIKRGVDIPASDIEGWGRQEYTYLRNGALSGMTAYEYHNPDVVFATTECENTEKGIPVKQVYETAEKYNDTWTYFKWEQEYDEIGQVTAFSNSYGYYLLYDEGKTVERGRYDSEGNRLIEANYSYYFDEETGCETTVREPALGYNTTGSKTITVYYGTEWVDQRSVYVDTEGVTRYEIYDITVGGFPYGVVETGIVAPDGTYIPDEPEETTEPTEETTEPTTPTEEPVHPSDEYDAEGRLIKHYEYDAEGNLVQFIKYFYDDAGNLSVSNQYDAEGNLIMHSEYSEGNLLGYEKYDATGLLIEFNQYDAAGGLIASHKFEYGSSSNWVRCNKYDAEGKLIEFHEPEYDAEGNQIEYNIYNAAGNLMVSSKYKYDVAGNQVELEMYQYDAEGNLIRIDKWDDTGKEIECIIYDAEGNLFSLRRFEYDAEGNEIRCNDYDAAGNLIAFEENEYDAIGRQTKCSRYDAEGNLIQIVGYKYDAMGRWDECNSYDAKGNLIQSTKYEYDAEGNQVGYNNDSYDSDGNLVVSDRITVSIDEETGYRTTVTTHLDGSKHEEIAKVENGIWCDIQTIYEYVNEDGNIVTEVTFPDGSVSVTIKDKDGNVIPQESTEETTESTEETTEPTEETTEPTEETTESTEETTESTGETTEPAGETTEPTEETTEPTEETTEPTEETTEPTEETTEPTEETTESTGETTEPARETTEPTGETTETTGETTEPTGETTETTGETTESTEETTETTEKTIEFAEDAAA